MVERFFATTEQSINMTYAPLFLFIVTLFSLITVLRHGRSTPRFLATVGGTTLWSVIVLGSVWLGNEGSGLSIVLIAGYLVVWVALLTLILDGDLWLWMSIIAVTAVIVALFLPMVTINLLQWGAVTIVPLVTLIYLREETRRNEVEINSGDPPASAPLVRFGQHDQNSIERDRPILEILPIGIVLAQGEGQVEYVNLSAADMLGVTRSDLIGQSIMTVLSRLPMLPRVMNSHERPKPTRFELNGRQIEGQMFLIESEKGSFDGSVAILEDISTPFEDDRVKSDFLTKVSNELRTPLTAIKGYVEMLENDQSQNLSRTQSDYLKTIQRNVTRMVHQINSLIYVASVKEQPQNIQRTVADLTEIVPKVVATLEPLASRNQLTVDVQLDPGLRPLQADSGHVKTIFQELLTNAIRFTESGGEIVVRVSNEAGESLSQSFVVVEIEDTGVGIDPIAQKTIFDDFTHGAAEPAKSGKAGGVGLAIVRALVETYSGRIWLESEQGEGSKFTFILPLKQPTNEQFALPVD